MLTTSRGIFGAETARERVIVETICSRDCCPRVIASRISGLSMPYFMADKSCVHSWATSPPYSVNNSVLRACAQLAAICSEVLPSSVMSSVYAHARNNTRIQFALPNSAHKIRGDSPCWFLTCTETRLRDSKLSATSPWSCLHASHNASRKQVAGSRHALCGGGEQKSIIVSRAPACP